MSGGSRRIDTRAVASARYLRDLIRAYDGYARVSEDVARFTVTISAACKNDITDFITLHCESKADTMNAFQECIRAFE